jgi:hypothetical protein
VWSKQASCLPVAFLSAPTFAVWRLAFLNATSTWHKADDVAEGGMESDALGWI